MFRLSRKFVAVLMLLWLPLFGGNALAASVSMQMQGACHDMTMPAMQQHGAGAQHALPDQHGTSCNDCGICHVACAGYLAAPDVQLGLQQQDERLVTPYLVSFSSVTLAPLDPPPTARL